MVYSALEDYIKELYSSIAIKLPCQLDIFILAERLNVDIVFSKSVSFYDEENDCIVIEHSSSERLWQRFGHELGHRERHVGNHPSLPQDFVNYQEWDATVFSYHFCVPTFMLEGIKIPPIRNQAIQLLTELFNVEFEFAEKRLDMFLRKKRESFFQNSFKMGALK
ncbi:ImmA/IrrE family metallo-endopeptidase [Virgibacillus senegalensis]|uniref:ImmA/IrrE family metallo-endopeptidase n=1 Tax=Virgibacillus senegalensis TaxID=1499679 RepID=UPI00069DA044|nr:ImmA/IrrE family metallo-endopeptidase [Virgibacillus senegalensis]